MARLVDTNGIAVTLSGFSLQISFADDPLRARLTAGPNHVDALRKLVPRFRSASQRNPHTADLEIDDLLGNLVVLASWPEPESVSWDENLAVLAQSVLGDAATVSAELADVTEDPPLSSEGRLGTSWIGDLTDFQQRDVQKLLRLRHGANFSVPGAGKTRVALALFAAAREAGEVERLLVVGPKSSYSAWEEENVASFRDPLRMKVFKSVPQIATDVLLVNYERLDGALTPLSDWLTDKPSMLVLDEAHRMKLGSNGTYGAACLALGPRARKRLILTGTPAPNGVRDLENLLGFVWPGQGRQAVTRAVAGGDLRQASAALKPLFTRTTKRELGLRPEITSIKRIPLPSLHREIYDALINQASARAAGSQDDFQALGKITVYLLMAATSPALLAVGTTRHEPLAYRVPPLLVPENAPLYELMRDLPAYEFSPKYEETLRIVAANARVGRKTLVWSTFVRSLTTLQRLLAEFQPALVHGGTEDREAEIKRFRNDPGCLVLLSNPATLGEGISLHHDCHDAVFVDRDFAAGRFLQSLDRIHRLGLAPETETHITVLASEGTIDDLVSQRLETKLQFMGRILDDPAVEQLGDLDEEPPFGGGLDGADIQSLLRHLHGNPA